MTTNAPYSGPDDNSLVYPRFLLFGDSITEYAYDQQPEGCDSLQFSLGAAMTNAYTRRFDVLQRGFGGYNTEWARIILPKIFALEHDSRPEAGQIKLMTMFLGSNDAAVDGPERVPLGRFEENLKFLIELVLSKGIKLILIGPALHNTERYRTFYPEEYDRGIYRTSENNLLYSDVIKRCAASYNVPFICLYDEFSKYALTADFNELLSDGLHFSGLAYKMLFDSVLDTVQVHYPQYHPSSLPRKLPDFENPDIIDILRAT